VAALFSAQAPLAEVLTVVAQDPIVILTEPRAGTLHDLTRTVLHRHPASHRYRSAPTEFPQRNFLHRSPGEEAGNRPTVDDLSVAQVDAVMDEADPRADEVGARRRFLRQAEPAVAPLWQGISSVCCMGP
jgi:hypothetical protein